MRNPHPQFPTHGSGALRVGADAGLDLPGRMRCNSIYNNFLEALAGLPVDVRFLSFDEVLEDGVPGDIDVIINSGKAGTSWSGGERWGDPNIVIDRLNETKTRSHE
jgi:hypothetical protein